MKRFAKIRLVWQALGLGLALLAGVDVATAHPLAPSLLDLRETEPGHFSVLWRRPLLMPAGANPQPVLPTRCRPVDPVVETYDRVALVQRWTVACGGGLRGENIEVSHLARAGSDVLLRVASAQGDPFQTVLRPDAPAVVLPAAAQSPAEVGVGYLRLGVEHLLTGWDHLAFVLALLLLVPGRRQLVGTITAFTLGHSLTLSVAALGFVDLPPAPIEMLIALSILVVAIELSNERPSVLSRRPWLAASSFGLLHGLGFAGALAEVGLPAGEIPLALFSFNVGIELGQLVFVAGLLTLGALFTPLRPRLPAWSTAVPVYAIGVLAACWTFERLAQL